MASSKAYFISESGTWPNEVYKIAISGNLIDPALPSIPCDNLFRYTKNQTITLNGRYGSIPTSYSYGVNATPTYDTQGIIKLDTKPSTLLTWDLGTMRKSYAFADQGSNSLVFNSLSLDIAPGKILNEKFYSYALYPKQLLLKPTAKPTKSGSNWVLNTQTVLLDTNTLFFLSSTYEEDIATENLKYLSKPPPTTSFALNSKYSIIYNLCACRIRAGFPVITFTNSYNPVYFSTVLESAPVTSSSKCRIRPDSTYITYDVSYYAQDIAGKYSLYSLGQQYYDDNMELPPILKSSYIIPYNLNTVDSQTFQLVQIKNEKNDVDLSEARYCALSAAFNLSNSNFSYYSKYYMDSSSMLVNMITGRPGSSIYISYIADCPTIKSTDETWESTLVSTGGVSLGVPLSIASTTPHNSINWTTKYPPHYYSYKAKLYDNSPSDPAQTYLETSNLTFYLKCSSVEERYTNGKNYTSSVVLSSFISSDFGFVNYDLWYGAQGDYIKFTPLVPTDSVFLSSIYCYYGDNLNKSYSLIDSPWVLASEANRFLVTYPVPTHGELDFNIRPTLRGSNGYLDAYESVRVWIAKGQLPTNAGQPIFISKIHETQDSMEVDSSFLVSSSSWPTRDLTNSYISWFALPQNNNFDINSIDSEGNYIQNIPPLSAVVFNYDTWSVAISGYGPTTVAICLSSQKYDEVTVLSSNSALFDYFVEGSLLVGSPYGLNNLNETRTIYLTCAVPYKGRQYNLPNDIKLNWVWSYNSDINYETIPISAYYTKNLLPYDYGYDIDSTLLSSIYINVKPTYNTNIPNLNLVNVVASVDSENGLVEGTYSFEVDDFPDYSIFNTDFTGYYSAFVSPYYDIANTRNGINVITRPNNGTNSYTFSALNDIIPNLSDSTIIWNVSSDKNVNLNYSGNSPINVNITNESKTIVTLSALSAIVAGWTSAHNVQTNCIIYTLDITEFNKQMEFLTIPEFFWTNGKYLTLSTPSNYTLIPSNTAYENKISNSQRYYLSANKSYFNDFTYYAGKTYPTSLESVSSYYQLVDVPFLNEIYSLSGLPIYLTAFNDTSFPKINGLYYKMPQGGGLKTFTFNITAKSNNSSTNPLQKYLKLSPYSNITTTYTLDTSSIDLDQDRVITIYQTISTSIPNPTVELESGTITYTLSNMFWSVSKDLPATTGYYDIFELLVGDPANELTVSGTKKSTLLLSVSSTFNKKIYSSTFDNYPDNQYTGPRDLWSSVVQSTSSVSAPKTLIATSTAANPELFISTAYTLTGSPFFIQYDTPDSIKNVYVIAYITDFGEPDSYVINYYDSTVFYSYKNSGTFYISYSALYNDGSLKMYNHPAPIFVQNDWKTYDPNSIRFVEETYLTLPYSKDEVYIQPNEWGDADIFNTSIARIQDNLDYLAANMQTINTNSPTILFGWLGSNSLDIGSGIKWYTRNFNSEYYDNPDYAISKGVSYFSDIRNAIELNDRMYVLDGTLFRCISSDAFAREIAFDGSDSLGTIFLNPISIEVDKTGNILFVSDPPKNKVYRFDLEFGSQSTINYTINVGAFGSKEDTNKFNSPSELSYERELLYVLDYNNKCVKEYNPDLNWVHTYYCDDFLTEQPINMVAHPKFELLYVLTKTKTVYIFERFSTNYFSKFKLNEVTSDILKIIFDEIGDFIYVITESEVFKYSSSGYFITQLDLPTNIILVGASKTKNRSILLYTKNSIIKIQDILEIHKVGEGLPSQYWSKDQLLLNKEELVSDTNYNRCLIRMAQNIKSFRSSLNYKLVLATEQTATNVIKYFTAIPINVEDLPQFDPYIEGEILGVGVNELHVPQVVNRELSKLYDAVYALKSFLDITEFNVAGNAIGCGNQFCWSWKGMSCYKLSFPAIRICNVNPITYAELETNFPVSYAPTKSWGAAKSECCDTVIPPV